MDIFELEKQTGAVKSSVWIVLKPKLPTNVGKKFVKDATA